MNKLMDLKKSILVLSVLLLAGVVHAQSEDKNVERKVSGSDVLAVGATTSTDSCLCNTVGGTIAAPTAKDRHDYLLDTTNPKGGTKEPGTASGQDGVD